MLDGYHQRRRRCQDRAGRRCEDPSLKELNEVADAGYSFSSVMGGNLAWGERKQWS
jgi:hypothetical protein